MAFQTSPYNTLLRSIKLIQELTKKLSASVPEAKRTDPISKVLSDSAGLTCVRGAPVSLHSSIVSTPLWSSMSLTVHGHPFRTTWMM
jgi:hypothetical protein